LLLDVCPNLENIYAAQIGKGEWNPIMKKVKEMNSDRLNPDELTN
jgi:hypothetical protein